MHLFGREDDLSASTSSALPREAARRAQVDGLEALKEAIADDAAQARKFFAKHG